MKKTEIFWDKLSRVRKEAIELLRDTVVYHKPFIDINEDEDEKYELPSTFYTDKHGYSYTYYIYNVVSEGNIMYFVGQEFENDSEYNFEIEDLSTETILQIIDQFHTQNG